MMAAHERTIPERPCYRFNGKLPSALWHLRDKPRWVAWDYRWKKNTSKWTKPPFNLRTGHFASVSDPATWGTYAEALAGMQKFGLAGVGLVLIEGGGISGIDIDDCIGGSDSVSPLAAEVISYAETYAELSPSGEGIRLFVTDDIAGALKDDGIGVEVYGHGRFLTVTGHHIEGTPHEIRRAPRTLAKLAAAVEAERREKRKPNGANGHAHHAHAGGGDFFSNVNAEGLANLDAWVPTLHPTARKHATGAWRVTSDALGRTLEEDLSYHPAGIRDHGEECGLTPIDAVQRYDDAKDAKAAAFWLCHKLGIEPARLGWRARQEKRTENDENEANEEATPTELPPSSDEALALKFAELHWSQLRYTHAWGKWHGFDSQCWREDKTLSAFDRARKLCREAAATIGKPSEQKDTASHKKRAAVVYLAREDRRMAATVEQWDRDAWLLNTPTGTIDLRTGEKRPHRPSDYITKMTAVAPGGACLRWLQFLEEITNKDAELEAYLQRVAGYLLTGDTREHAFFFFYGTGANGKSVFLATLAGILDDYHRAAPIEAFTASLGDRHPTELAMLRGARLATASETEEGRHWAESRIKLLTGGDKVSARFMRQDFFEYVPEFKLLIAGNHKPALRSVDEAIRRRLHLVPFTVTIAPAKRDLKLAETLKAEWPGILQWAIDGCAMWQRLGLAPPKVVADATTAYLEDEDPVLAWVAERCTMGRFSPLKELYGSWRAYAETIREDPRTNKWFRQRLDALGYRSRKVELGIAVFGLELKV
jgi:putative DNA primase/helicase